MVSSRERDHVGETLGDARVEARERLEREFDLDLISTSPNVVTFWSLMEVPKPSVSTRPAAFTAATSVVWSFELTALSTISLVGYIAAPPTIGLPVSAWVSARATVEVRARAVPATKVVGGIRTHRLAPSRAAAARLRDCAIGP